jgi:hypothetical protein
MIQQATKIEFSVEIVEQYLQLTISSVISEKIFCKA